MEDTDRGLIINHRGVERPVLVALKYDKFILEHFILVSEENAIRNTQAGEDRNDLAIEMSR